MPKAWLLFLPLLLFSVGTHADPAWDTRSSRALENLLQNNPGYLQQPNKAAIINFYNERKHKLLWSDENGRLNRAYDLLNVITHAEEEGLLSSDYNLKKIREFWALNNLDSAIHLDLFLSAALYRYSNDVYSGKFDPSDLDIDWHIENKPLDISHLFAAVAGKRSIAALLDKLPPQYSGYQLLKKQLQILRELEQQGGWQQFKNEPSLRAGIQHKQVLQLRKRLEMTGDRIETSFPDMDIFDYGLTEAVKRFQQRHGLTVDGVVGPKTKQALNITVSERIRLVRINMERWRWMPRTLEKRHLMVNMTGFELHVMENGLSVLSMPVIIGNSFRSTPSFSGLVSQMKYNPYWTIPTNIALKDVIPKQIRDPSYFSKKSIRVYRGWENAQEIDPQTVNWNKLVKIDKDHFPYWLRQEPGPKNSLGLVKFLFSNPYDIYLHGTPDIHLFDRIVRAFSSGCIRVKDPVRLAAYLLNDDSQQKEEEILENIFLAGNQSVMLPVAVPIYLVYWTAWVDQDGNLNFRDDIYRRDEKLNGSFDN
ncbi:MAG: L,D-transpeptidase family protein [Gammaproteobacteria bacterium]|nr:L,D-transpeptidase family protein [Gammaproteobacteria bacterium]